jgi:hypothetical protein
MTVAIRRALCPRGIDQRMESHGADDCATGSGTAAKSSRISLEKAATDSSRRACNWGRSESSPRTQRINSFSLTSLWRFWMIVSRFDSIGVPESGLPWDCTRGAMSVRLCRLYGWLPCVGKPLWGCTYLLESPLLGQCLGRVPLDDS